MKKISLLVASLVASLINLHAQIGEDKNMNPIDGKTISVGTLPGSFNISPTGAATYTIPIDLPPGRAGMTPEIALSYNSQTSDGVMGKGWGIAGWSYIERLNETQYYDNSNGSIDFADDVFSWDGNRLIKTGGGFNENDFRTEVDNVAQIKMMNANKESTYFIIHTKEGLIKYYGATTDSRQVSLSNDKPAIRYHLNKIEDRKGNYIQYDYDRTVTTGELYLKKIKYTLHGQIPTTTPYEVDFVYSSIDPKYYRFYLFSHGNVKYEYQITKKLDAIKIVWNGVTIKTYTINYVGGGLFGTKHFVNNIVLKGLNGTQEFNPTNFDWNFNAASQGIHNNAFADEKVENFHVAQFTYGTGDFDGDGITDIIQSGLFSRNKQGTYLRVSKNMTPIKISNDYFISPAKFINCDIDGDGRDELFVARSGSLRCYRFQVTGSTITPLYMGERSIDFVAQGDFTGDGLFDIIVKNNSVYQLYRGNIVFNDFWNSPFSITNPVFLEGQNRFRTGDFNGDGKSDFSNFKFGFENTFGVWTLKFNESPSTYSFENMEFQAFQGIPLTAITILAFDVGDFNGDGKEDMLLTIKDAYGNIGTNICYAYGKGWQVNPVTDLGNYYSNFQSEEFGHVVTDLNNDGIADVGTYYFTFPGMQKIQINFKKFFKYPGVQGGFKSKSVDHLHDYSATVWDGVQPDGIVMGDFSGNGEKDICYILNFEEWRQSEKLPVGTRRYAYTLTDEEVGSDLIVKATNGLGSQSELLYSKYDPKQYTYTSYPVLRFMAPFYVVSSVKTSNGTGGFFPSTTYDYTGMQAHAQGKGLLGFQKINVTDNLAGVKSVTTYNLFIQNNMYFFIYPADIKQYALSNNQLLSHTTNMLGVKNLVPGYSKVFYPVTTLSFTTQSDLNGTYIGSRKSLQSFSDIDEYGNSKKMTQLKSEWVWDINAANTAYTWCTTTENQYNQNDIQNWLVGRPTQTKITRYHNENGDHTDITRQDFAYYPSTAQQWPLLETVTTTPNGSELLTTQIVYDYDMFGNIIKETFRAPFDDELNDRITEYQYALDNGYDARFMTSKIVYAPGDFHQSYYFYNLASGNMTFHKDISGLETTFDYDGMGNHYATNHPDGNATKHYVNWSSGNSHAPPGAKYYTTDFKLISTLYQSWGLTITYYDALGRELRTVIQNLNGTYVYVDKSYDNKGRLFKVSDPYFRGSPTTLFTIFSYDPVGRPETKTNTDGTIIKTTYNGRAITTTNLETDVWSTKTVNAAGIIDLSSDPSGTINNDYDGAGRLIQTHAANILTSIEYDEAGNRSKLIDPDAGTTETRFNAFGELKYQKDGQGNEYTMIYDDMGRLLSKSTSQGDLGSTDYQYENNKSHYGFGQVKEQSLTYPVDDNQPFVYYNYTYDHLGRIITREESVGNQAFTFSYQYNPDHGKLEYTTYPSGYKVKHVYNQYGYFFQVVNNGTVLWQANEMNARGQLQAYDLGNGLTTYKYYNQYGYIASIYTPGVQMNSYIFDAASGNLTYQGDYLKTWAEYYGYDDDLLQSRLKSWTISSQINGSIDYLPNGNINKKSDVTTSLGQYDYVGAGPHAVTKVTGPTPQYLQKAKEQAITYTSFNKVKEITQQFYAPAVDRHRLKFAYGPDQARKKTEYFYVMVDGTEILRKTKYFVGKYEVEKDDAGNERKLHYIGAGDGIFAIVEIVNQGGAQIHYIHKNYLGSFDAITNSIGAVEERLSFDPWGRRRNPETGVVDDNIHSLFDRGFTGHQHLNEFGLINMNGRLYDPVLARFLSPDPYLQAPDNLQNHNRYSYALNNPMRYTDPSGEWIHLAIGAFIGGVINWAAHGAQFNAAGLGYFGVGALAGAMAAGIGAGIGGLVSGAGSFSFSVPSSLAQWGFLPGAAVGGAAGITNGVITGTGNSLVSGKNITESLVSGLNAAWKQGLTGAAIGGVSAGISAVAHGRKFWTGGTKGSMYVSAERLSINVPEQRAELSIGSNSTELKPFYVDSELYFDGESLLVLDNYSNQTQSLRSIYNAQSGSATSLPIPADNIYSISNIEPNYTNNLSYVRDGIGFFADIDPYTLPNGRFGFEIHPDGALNGNWWVNNGTGGCIGIQENASELIQLRNFIQTYIQRYSIINLSVQY